MLTYLASLRWPLIVLWCYLGWYLTIVIRYFDGSPALWTSSLGISAIIGAALLLSVSVRGRPRPDNWTIFRLFLMPFCVSSYSALIKGHGFVLIFPPSFKDNALAAGTCLCLVTTCWAARRISARHLRRVTSKPAVSN